MKTKTYSYPNKYSLHKKQSHFTLQYRSPCPIDLIQRRTQTLRLKLKPFHLRIIFQAPIRLHRQFLFFDINLRHIIEIRQQRRRNPRVEFTTIAQYIILHPIDLQLRHKIITGFAEAKLPCLSYGLSIEELHVFVE